MSFLEDVKSVPQAFRHAVEENRDRPFLTFPKAERQKNGFETVSETYGEVEQKVNRFAHYLKSLNLPAESTVLVLSDNCPESVYVALGAQKAGLAHTPLMPEVRADEVQRVIETTEAPVVIIENQEQLKKIQPALGENSPVREVVSFTDTKGVDSVVKMQEVIAEGLFPDTEPEIEGISRDSKALQLYTSGSSGTPKGVEITHEALLSCASMIEKARLFEGSERVIQQLKLPHSYPYAVLMCSALSGREVVLIRKAQKRSRMDPRAMRESLPATEPDILPTVPQLPEKINNKIIKEVEKAEQATPRSEIVAAIEDLGEGAGPIAKVKATFVGGWNWFQKKYFAAAMTSAQEHYLGTGGVWNTIKFHATSPARRSLVNKMLGSRIRYALTGGAPLSADVAKNFDSCGVELVQGYGATELFGPTHSQIPRILGGEKRFGSIGKPLPGVEDRIDPETGELQIKTKTAMRGYFKNPEKTSAAFTEDGFYRTGDKAEKDADGYVYITGHIDRLYNSVGGEKIYPEKMEDLIRKHELVGSVVVWGDGKPNNVAVVSLDEDAAKVWAQEHGVSVDELSENTELRKELLHYFRDEVNPKIEKHESIEGLIISPGSFRQLGLMVASGMKESYQKVLAHFAEDIEKQYT